MTDFAYLCMERFDAVGRYVPRRLDVVLVEEFQKSVDSNSCTKDSTGNIHRICLGAILGVDPVVERSGTLEYSKNGERYQFATASTSTP